MVNGISLWIILFCERYWLAGVWCLYYVWRRVMTYVLCYKLFWNWIGVVRFQLYLTRFFLTKAFLFDPFFVVCCDKLCCCDHWVFRFGSFSIPMDVKPNSTLKSNAPHTRIFYEKKCAAVKICLWKECAAGKSYIRKWTAGKIVLTESWFVICPVNAVCKSWFTNHSLEFSFFNWWINELMNEFNNSFINSFIHSLLYALIKPGPSQSMFVCPTYSYVYEQRF